MDEKRGLIEARFDDEGRLESLTVQNVNAYQMYGVAGMVLEQARIVLNMEMQAGKPTASPIIPVRGSLKNPHGN
jgi:hypothetical protein